MTITPTTSNAAFAQALPGSERTPKQTLGQEDFLRLLAVQFATQDPLNPMDDTEFIAQMANFTSLETSAKLANDFERFADQTAVNAAQSLLGRTVTVGYGEEQSFSGIVSAVRNTSEGPLVTIDGAEFPASDITRVELTTDSTSGNSNQP